VIIAGLITGVVVYYWLMPKWAAARIVRAVESYNRRENERKAE